MDYLQQYYRLLEIKPPYHRLMAPYLRPSHNRFTTNVKELELYFDGNVFVFDKPDSYKPDEERNKEQEKGNKKGGEVGSKSGKKIMVVQCSFAQPV